MTQREFVNTRREGMVQLYQKLVEFYKQEGAFDYLKLEDIEEMIKDIDKNNIMNWNRAHGEGLI